MGGADPRNVARRRSPTATVPPSARSRWRTTSTVEARAGSQGLFFTGKPKIEGDMGLARKLEKLTATVK